MTPSPLIRLAMLAFPFLLAGVATAGGSPENVLLLVDPSSPVSMQVANHYRAARDIPDRNVVYIAPNPGNYSSFPTSVRPAFLGTLANQKIGDHVDYVVLTPGVGFYMNASGIVTDGCSAVNRFAVTAPYALAQLYSTVPTGISSQASNAYSSTSNDSAIAFDANTSWSGGAPFPAGSARFYIATMLGWDGINGNTTAEILSMIDRSVAADESHPSGTFYFCQTNDIARSGPRHGFYPGAVASITALGLNAQHLMADLPPSNSTCTGIMTGLADPLIDATPLALVPGAFCDHLTSYAGTFDGGGQTKCSRWIAKGASGSSGTVEEPCNYPGKFPHARLHVYYAAGLSLGEAWFRSLAYLPFQQIFVGDPLTRPWSYLPTPALAGVPATPASGTIVLVPSATTTHPTAAIAGFELFVDGVSVATTNVGGSLVLDTTALDDGVHELRLLAWDNTSVKSTGRAITTFSTNNFGRAATLAVAPTNGNLTTRFDFSAAASGGTIAELRLVQGARVVASATAAGTISVFGRTLGADTSRLVLEAEFTDGRVARSAPVAITVADSAGTPLNQAPIAFSYTKRVRNDVAALIELPAAFDDALSSAGYMLIAAPVQGTILGSTSGAWRIVQPNVGASGVDTLVFRAVTASGASTDATVKIVWQAPVVCSAPTNFCVSTPNSTGLPATMSSSGSTRIGDNNFSILAYDLPPQTFGLFYYGSAPTQVAFGNGWRCVASPVQRLSVQQASVFGDMSRAIDFTQNPFVTGPASIHAGTTKYFQCWYRNPAAGGAGFNLSDGLSVTFCP